jgi:hypothetical protein
MRYADSTDIAVTKLTCNAVYLGSLHRPSYVHKNHIASKIGSICAFFEQDVKKYLCVAPQSYTADRFVRNDLGDGKQGHKFDSFHREQSPDSGEDSLPFRSHEDQPPLITRSVYWI